MFGLMRAKKCGMPPEEKAARRLNYCGTCKTIGTLYGQKARLLLNLDIVFLAELLNYLAGENSQNWQNSFQSYNCFNLPDEAEIPPALLFAATANVILTRFKIADHISDSNKYRYRFAGRIFTNEFQKAEKLLKRWNFPLVEIENILAEQENIEAAAGKNFLKTLETCASPTAQTTAIFFAEGVRQTGQTDFQSAAYEIGFAFGKLIYLLDAFEDYEKDLKENQFNAIRSAYDLSENKIPGKIRRRITSIFYELEGEVVAGLYKLPIGKSQKELFAARLKQNLQRKIATNLPVLKIANAPRQKAYLNFSERWNKAREISRGLTASLQKNWRIPLVFAFVFIVALVLPAQAKQARSWQECAGLGLSLPFLFSLVLVPAKSILLQNQGETPGNVPPPVNPQRTKKSGGSGSSGAKMNAGFCSGFGCCDCLDGCDCCCDCSDCCCSCDC